MFFVPEVGLERPRVVTPVGQRIATGMPDHVRVNLKVELGLNARAFDHTGETGGAERRAAFRCEYE
jgi:hypothetical protein